MAIPASPRLQPRDGTLGIGQMPFFDGGKPLEDAVRADPEGPDGHGQQELDRYLLDSRETGGAIAVVEYNLAPRILAAPVHRHSREDQYSLVLEGRLGVFQDDEVVVAEPGELVLKPRGHWHTFWNAGDQPLRVLEMNVPGGLEELFRSLAALGDSYDPETLPAMARQYGCDVDFERTMPLVEQHDLIF